MFEVVFKGKEYVYNHHLSAPYRPLLPDAKKGIGPADPGGNLVIHGDNLHALKALLPRYAGKVDLVFIDPSCNSGDEGRCYSDNVNSPMMRVWLSNSVRVPTRATTRFQRTSHWSCQASPSPWHGVTASRWRRACLNRLWRRWRIPGWNPISPAILIRKRR